jgi:two-component system alkaline phosphatase synthesis response regulator PhoP
MKDVWVVEDEPDIADLVAHHLRKEPSKVSVFYDGESYLEALKKHLPDLVVLDLMLPGINGLDICRIMRSDERTKPVPVVMLTAKSSELDIVLGLELGADDYVVKPFSVKELMARIKNVLRRSEHSQTSMQINVEGLFVDPESFDVRVDNTPVKLTYSEFRILRILLSRPQRVFTRQEIIEMMWDEYRIVTPKTVDVHIGRLRRKLGKYGHFIKTVRRVGYKFEQ